MAWVFLTHPGPSLLVTALVTGAAAALAGRGISGRTEGLLVAVTLPSQLAVGSLNDWADAHADAQTKPYKPIVRGLVPRTASLALALCGFAASLVAAGFLGPAVLGLAVVAGGAGAAYDLLLKRTPLAIVAWWAGFTTVPLIAMAADGRWRAAPVVAPLAGLLALALLLANGLPDAEGDARAGARTLPSVLGATWSRRVLIAALIVAAACVFALHTVLGQGVPALLGAGVLAVGAAIPVLTRAHPRWCFPLLAMIVAVAVALWMVAVAAAA